MSYYRKVNEQIITLTTSDFFITIAIKKRYLAYWKVNLLWSLGCFSNLTPNYNVLCVKRELGYESKNRLWRRRIQNIWFF